jgi:hypothetical protein
LHRSIVKRLIDLLSLDLSIHPYPVYRHDLQAIELSIQLSG